MVVTAGVTVKVLVPLKSFQPVQPPDAQQESAVPVTVQVRVEMLLGKAVERERSRIGGTAVTVIPALTVQFGVSFAPSATLLFESTQC